MSRMRPVRGPFLLAVLAVIGTAALWFAPEQTFVGPPRCDAGRTESALAMRNQYEGSEYKGDHRYSRYQGYVFRRKPQLGLRIRLVDYGQRHYPFYRIIATFQPRKSARTSRYLELIGWWDPNKDLDNKHAFAIRADRVMHWLRRGANPTKPAANLFDITGLIRRTGPWPKRGEWEYRLDKSSGPEEPEGWSWDGPQKVTWGNPNRVRHFHDLQRPMDGIPKIERFGFQGYERIPLDFDAANEPLEPDALQEAFPNTYLPVG